jgi:hypothetical protein
MNLPKSCPPCGRSCRQGRDCPAIQTRRVHVASSDQDTGSWGEVVRDLVLAVLILAVIAAPILGVVL